LAQFILERFLFLQFLVASMQQFNPAIEHISVRSLKPYPRNARRHSRAQIKQIAASIKRFGFNNPVLIADDGEIVAGHGRVSAAKLLGIETVPAVRLSRLCDRRQQTRAQRRLGPRNARDRIARACRPRFRDRN
jgi:ParB-like nuclease domain